MANRQPSDLDTSISSTLQALKKLNKEKETKDAAAEAVKVRCRTCFRETSPKFYCVCGGGGGGGGGGGEASENESDNEMDLDELLTLTKSKSKQVTHEWSDELESELDIDPSLKEPGYDPAIISELIEAHLLVVRMDLKSKTLSIDLKCEFNSLSEQQKKELTRFTTAIMKQFTAFQKNNPVANDCLQIQRDDAGNIMSLKITLPTVALYLRFMDQLSKQLLPTPQTKLQGQVEAESAKTPNPLSMEPKFEPKKNDREKEEKRYLSPFNLEPKPGVNS